MPTTKLTKRQLDTIKPQPKPVFWFDSDVKGFGLKVMPSGVMSWLVEYRPGAVGRATQKRRLTLGKAGTLTPEEARELARGTLAKVHGGDDPAARKSEARTAMTVGELCDLYLREAERGHIIGKRGAPKKASTLATDRGRIERHIIPLLGRKVVRDIAQSDIERFLRDVADGRTAADIKTKKHGRARVVGGRGTATRTVRLLGGLFTFAKRLGLRTDNPTHGVVKYADAQGGRFLTTEELDRLGAALITAETVGLPWHVKALASKAKHVAKDIGSRRSRVSPYATAAIRLLILTGCRLREILTLEWSHVDFERGLLFIPDSKTGAKTVVLAAPALAVLSAIERLEGSNYVIPGDRPNRPRSDLKRPWEQLTRTAALEGVRLHDLRHTFASYGAAAGMGLTIIGRLLGHNDPKTTNRYSHFDTDPLRRAANAVGSKLAASVAKDYAEAGAEVIQLRR